jgi:tetratricopeptide (TPR) repeat protein
LQKNISSAGMIKRGLIVGILCVATLIAASAQDKATEYLKAAIELNQQNQYDASVELCNHALHLEPTMSSAWFLRGYNHYRLEKYQEAIDDFSVALHYQKNYSDAYYYRGRAHQANGSYYQALLDLNKARKLDPGRATVLMLRGIFR